MFVAHSLSWECSEGELTIHTLRAASHAHLHLTPAPRVLDDLEMAHGGVEFR